jgi:hypothetical protein
VPQFEFRDGRKAALARAAQFGRNTQPYASVFKKKNRWFLSGADSSRNSGHLQLSEGLR